MRRSKEVKVSRAALDRVRGSLLDPIGMKPGEIKVRTAVYDLASEGKYPSARAISERLELNCPTLSGWQCAWRRKAFRDLNIPLRGPK